MLRRRFLGAWLTCAAGASRAVGGPARPVDAWAEGLDTSGAADMTAYLQRAVDAAGIGGVLRFPPGDIRLGGRVQVTHDRQQWVGAGRGVTRLLFTPVDDDAVMLRFGKMQNITPQQSIAGMTLTSDNLALRKTAIQLVDTSAFVMRDVEITGLRPAAGTLAWSGGSGGSIGVHTLGREAPRFGGGCYVSADNPFRISRNARASSPQVDADFFSLRDVYMVANGLPNILIDGDVELSNFLVDGCSMVRGSHAIRWIGRSASRATSLFAVRSCRWEQAEDASAYAFDIQPNRNLYGLSFDGVSLPPEANGFRLRNCVAPSFRHVVCNQGAGREVLDVDASVIHMVHEDCYWGSGTSVNMAGQRVVWAGSRTSNREPLPRNGQYDSERNAEIDLAFDAALAGRSVVLADRGVEAIGGAQARGWLLVSDDEGGACQVALRGNARTVFYSATLDAARSFSATPGRAGRTNIYWSAERSRYELENLRGAKRSYRLALVGASGPRLR